jgi:hypothetical protein
LFPDLLPWRPIAGERHLCHRVPSVAGSGFSGTPMHRGALYIEGIRHGTGRSACATREVLMGGIEFASKPWDTRAYGST